MRVCVSLPIKVQILAFYTDVFTAHNMNYLSFLAVAYFCTCRVTVIRLKQLTSTLNKFRHFLQLVDSICISHMYEVSTDSNDNHNIFHAVIKHKNQHLYFLVHFEQIFISKTKL